MSAHERNEVQTETGGLFHPDNPWTRIAWGITVGVVVVAAILGFVVLGGVQQNGPRLGTWDAICRALGITSDTRPAGAPQPPLTTPTNVAWTPATLAQIAAGNAERGASVAAGCVGCHGEQGVSQSGQFPTLAGMEPAVIYKQLDDFRSDKRSSSVMKTFAAMLSPQQSADVAAYFASRGKGLAPSNGEPFKGGHTLREANPATRLVFAGDPARGMAPCASCHGPSASKLGAPSLQGQKPEYIQTELAAFASGNRRNDINQQMRSIAKQLTPAEMQALAQSYGASVGAPIARQ